MLIKDLYNQSVLLLNKAQIPSPALDARLIIEYSLGLKNHDLHLNKDVFLPVYTNRKTMNLIKKRAKKEPVAYITQKKEFFGLDFFVNKNVLIPRPESEWLVEESIKHLESSIKHGDKNVLDLGTGSGCIIISLLHSLKIYNLKFKINSYASDISKKALHVAKKNAELFDISNINFIQSDLFSNRLLKNKKFDLIVANLPYVPINGAHISTLHEPKLAIFAKENGAATIKRFLKEAKDYLNKTGLILIELDPRNAKKIKKCARENFPDAIIELKKDLAGNYRYLAIQSNQA